MINFTSNLDGLNFNLSTNIKVAGKLSVTIYIILGEEGIYKHYKKAGKDRYILLHKI